MAGRGYQAVTKPGTTGPSGQTYWQCYDIRTGEIFWERPLFSGEAEPTIIEYGITSIEFQVLNQNQTHHTSCQSATDTYENTIQSTDTCSLTHQSPH